MDLCEFCTDLKFSLEYFILFNINLRIFIVFKDLLIFAFQAIAKHTGYSNLIFSHQKLDIFRMHELSTSKWRHVRCLYNLIGKKEHNFTSKT